LATSSFDDQQYLSAKDYLDRVLEIGGSITVDYKQIVHVEGEATFEQVYKTEKNSISLFQIGYKEVESLSIDQTKLQDDAAYTSSKYIHPSARKSLGVLKSFTESQGNYYVSKITKGLFAVRKVRFNFGSEEDKLAITANIKGNIDLKTLQIGFTANFGLQDDTINKKMSISTKTHTLGGNSDLLKVDFTDSFENIEDTLKQSWDNFFKTPTNLNVLSAELSMISRATHVLFSRTQAEANILHDNHEKARNRMKEVQTQSLQIKFAQMRSEFMMDSLGYGSAGAKNALLEPFTSMGDDFQTYHLDEHLKTYQKYLARGEQHILDNDLPTFPLSDGVDVNNKAQGWLKKVDLDPPFMKKITDLLKGGGRIQTKIKGYDQVIFDGSVAYGVPTGVPDEILFFYKNARVEEMGETERNSNWVFKFRGEQWNAFTGQPRVGTLPILSPFFDIIDFDQLPDWLGNLKYKKEVIFDTSPRKYRGFWKRGKFYDTGILINTDGVSDKSKFSFKSIDIRWIRGSDERHIAERLTFKCDVCNNIAYSGEIKYDDISKTVIMHGEGHIDFGGKLTHGTWEDGKYVVNSDEDIKKLQPFLLKEHRNKPRSNFVLHHIGNVKYIGEVTFNYESDKMKEIVQNGKGMMLYENEKVDIGEWKNNKILIDSKNRFDKLQPFLKQVNRYELLNPTGRKSL